MFKTIFERRSSICCSMNSRISSSTCSGLSGARIKSRFCSDNTRPRSPGSLFVSTSPPPIVIAARPRASTARRRLSWFKSNCTIWPCAEPEAARGRQIHVTSMERVSLVKAITARCGHCAAVRLPADLPGRGPRLNGWSPRHRAAAAGAAAARFASAQPPARCAARIVWAAQLARAVRQDKNAAAVLPRVP
jgi:hypothetical protein